MLTGLDKDAGCDIAVEAVNGRLRTLDGNAYGKFRIDGNHYNATEWVESKHAADTIGVDGNAAGVGFIKLTKSALLANTVTEIYTRERVRLPVRLGFGMSLSQRIAGQELAIQLVSVNGQTGVPEVQAPAQDGATALVSGSPVVATNVWTVTLTDIPPFFVGDRVALTGAADSRLNVGPVIVTAVSLLANSITFTSTLANGTYPPGTPPTVTRLDPLTDAPDGTGLILDGTTVTNAIHTVRGDAGPHLTAAPVSFGTNYSVALIPAGYVDTPFAYMQAARYRTELQSSMEALRWTSTNTDGLTANNQIVKRDQSLPNIDKRYALRVRVKNLANMTVPVGRVVSMVKSGSTTATITFAAPHGLTVSDYITIYGARDQTNFVNLTTATVVASTPDATSITIAFGASATATNYGGTVFRVQGGGAPGVIVQSIQSAVRAGGVMTLAGSATWAGLVTGDTVTVHGVFDTAGADAGLDGVYKVGGFTTASLFLISPGVDFSSVNVGGTVIKNTDLRLNYVKALDYTRHLVEVTGGNGHSDISNSAPVTVNAMPTVTTTGTVTAGQAAHDAVITGAPVRIAARAMSANYTAVAAGDVADLLTTLVGALIGKPYSIPELDWSYVSAGVFAATTNTLLRAAGAAGIRHYLTAAQMKNVHASTACELLIIDGGTAAGVDGTIIARYYLPAVMLNDDGLALPTPLRGTAATALHARLSAAGSVYMNFQGYAAP